MKRFNVLLLIIAFTGIVAQAQDKSELFFTGLAERSVSVKSFSGDFLQKKKIRLTDREMVSKGTVRYDKGSAIRFDYVSPRKMSIVVGKSDLKIITPEKTTTYDLSAQKELSALVAVMNDCLAGNVKGLSKDCKVEYMEENSAHVVRQKRNSLIFT
jgi:outer membrane lipoprotein-sorting protein